MDVTFIQRTDDVDDVLRANKTHARRRGEEEGIEAPGLPHGLPQLRAVFVIVIVVKVLLGELA